ncbi:hypothetical protein ACP70R_044778 [Stipagrostis hirtigluma subsp. patula]
MALGPCATMALVVLETEGSLPGPANLRGESEAAVKTRSWIGVRSARAGSRFDLGVLLSLESLGFLGVLFWLLK